MFEENEFSFVPLNNSLLVSTLSRIEHRSREGLFIETRHPPEELTTNIGVISGTYLYTNTPPHGYGTQAPKVAETINRAYDFNLKKGNKSLYLDGEEVERTHWEECDGNFPFEETHGNFLVGEMKGMIEWYLIRNHVAIDNTIEQVMERLMNTNSDVLTKGRQTLCSFSDRSVPAPAAYISALNFMKANTNIKAFSCIEWLKTSMSLFESETLIVPTYEDVVVKKRVYSKSLKQRVVKEKTIRRKRVLLLTDKKEIRKKLLNLYTKFASYLKHKERGKKDRRAIASGNVFIRMFLYLQEEFALKLSKRVSGATISIGGEEKKAKIVSTRQNARLNRHNFMVDATEDAKKWNECLQPSCFATLNHFLFDNKLREELGIPLASNQGILYKHLATMGNMLMALKRIILGPGMHGEDDATYQIIGWSKENLTKFNSQILEWYPLLKPVDSNYLYVRASPGMLMGMLNGLSTIVGMLPENYRMKESMRVTTLRSSDDSLTMFTAQSDLELMDCVKYNRMNLGMLGINLSTEKTLFFRGGFGEYTSWYIDDKFISQYGVDTSSIRPGGKNPADDFFQIAKNTATGLSNLQYNHLGGSARLRLGIENVRRLWRVERCRNKRENISDDVLLLSDGGKSPWDSSNCHLEETSLSNARAVNDEERNYLLRVRHPECPLTCDPEEQVSYNKELGILSTVECETPRTCFHYMKRTNRSAKDNERKEAIEIEKAYNEAFKIISSLNPTVHIQTPKSNELVSHHLMALIFNKMSEFELTETERCQIDLAIRRLETGVVDDPEDEDDFWEMEEMND